MKDAFYGYHPLVNFTYFALVLAFSMVFMHPLCLGISLCIAVVYSIKLKGKKAVKFNLLFLLPMLLVTALINPIFNHEGQTILMYLQSGNPLTLESIVYGLAASVMMAAVICWFSCYNEVLSSDKFVYLFGRVIPAMSLILSMVLRFVPKFKAQIREVSQTQRCVGRDVANGSVLSRARHGITILSIMVTWSLENAIETADSMKSRGYGMKGRTAFSIYRFDKRDRKALIAMILLAFFIILGGFGGRIDFRYFPTMGGSRWDAITILLMVAYLILCAVPLILDWEEDRKWKATQSKI